MNRFLALLLLLPVTLRADGVWTLRLEKALTFGKAAPADLELTLTERGGVFEPVVWGWTAQIPGQEHVGSVTGNTARLQVRLPINHDRSKDVTLGGLAEFTIELNGKSGTFTGKTTDANRPEVTEQLEKAWGWGFKPVGHAFMQPLIRNRLRAFLATSEVTGKVTATVAPLPVTMSAVTEHPRLLFRKSDLPEIRRRLETAEGRQIMAALEDMLDRQEKHGFAFFPPAVESMMFGVWAAGCGFKYQLTGDKKWANRAMGLGVGAMYGVYYYGGWWIHPYQIMGMALAYDLCYDAWPEDYRNMVYCFLFQNIRDLAMRHDETDLLGTRRVYRFANDQQQFRFDGVRDYGAQKLRAAAAIAALALRGDPVPVYRPAPLDTVRVIEPARDYTPWVSVPVVPFTSNKMPGEWLVNGPFRRGLVADPLAEIGGFANARPEEGTLVTHDGVKLDFRRYDPAGTMGEMQGPHIYPRNCNRFWTSSTGGGYYTGIELVKRWREQLGHGPGIEITIFTVLDNDRERVVQARPNWGWQSHGIRMWLNGVEVKDGELVRLKPGLYAWMCDVPVMGGYSNQGPHLREYGPRESADDMAAWHAAQVAFGDAASKGASEMDRNLSSLVHSVQRFMTEQIAPDGSGGWNDSIHETLFPFLLAYRNVTGNDLAAGTGVQEFFVQGLRARGQHWRNVTAQSLGLLPEKYKPVAVWQTGSGLSLRRPHEAIMALMTYPFGVAPQHPREQFALAASLPGHGLHQFASAWEGDKTFLVQFEHGASPMASPFAFGNIGITGLGRSWAPFHGKRYRWEEQFDLNKVSAHDHFHVQGGRVVHAELRPDGGGVVSVVADTFRKGEVVANTGGPGAHIVWDQKAKPQVRMLRSVAVDYSGACGAPALIVIADRVSGLTANSEKNWRLDLGGVADHAVLDAKTRTFTVGRSGPTMRGAVVLPATADCKLAPYGRDRGVAFVAQADRRITDRERAEKNYQRDVEKTKSTNTDTTILDFEKYLDRQDRAAVTSDTVFLVVLTLQEGPAPTVRTEAGKTSVGKVAIQFDGEKVVLAPASPPQL